jgi:hypothetical protein
MKKELYEKILNRSLRQTINLYFGDNSFIKIKNISHIRSKNSYLVNMTVYVSDIEKTFELLPDSLELVCQLGWKVINRKSNLILNYTIDSI